MEINPKQLMEDGWKARENLDFDKAEKLLNESLKLFEKSEDWFNVTEALNHLAYTEKLRAIQHNVKGVNYTTKANKVAEEHGTKKTLTLRAAMSLASSAGLFEQALKFGYECLSDMHKPFPRADILSHVALFQLRTGQLLNAENSINESEALLENNWDSENEPHRSIWASKILYTKGLILFNKKDFDNSKKYLARAYDISQKNNLKTRVVEIEEIMKMFE